MDSDSGVQKVHKNPTPRVGGIAIFISMIFGLLFLFSKLNNINYVYIIIAGLPIVLCGFFEDICKKIGAYKRLSISFLSALLAIYFLNALIIRTGIPALDSLTNIEIISVIFTVIAISGVINSINIIDGVNGLSSGTSIFMFFCLGYIAFKVNDYFILSICFLAVAAILGFFVWNFPFGKIFLGDGGAYFIGYLLAVLSVLLVRRHNEVSPLFAVLVLIYPVFETLFSIYRRKILKKKNPLKADALHLHTLFYKRAVPALFGNGNTHTSMNSATSPFLWGLCISSLLPATLFWQNTTILFIFAIGFCLFYIVLYRSIVKFKLKKILGR